MQKKMGHSSGRGTGKHILELSDDFFSDPDCASSKTECQQCSLDRNPSSVLVKVGILSYN